MKRGRGVLRRGVDAAVGRARPMVGGLPAACGGVLGPRGGLPAACGGPLAACGGLLAVGMGLLAACGGLLAVGMGLLAACGGGGGVPIDAGLSDNGQDAGRLEVRLDFVGPEAEGPAGEAVDGDLPGEAPDAGRTDPEAVGEGALVDPGEEDLPEGTLDAPHDGVADADATPGCPGGPWCPCSGNDECDSSYCIDTWGGPACTVPCTDESSCPQAWRCTLVSQAGGDPAYVCVDPFVRLCSPCKTDAECVPAVGAGATGFSCLDRGPEGRFCTAACKASTDCPAGFECIPDRRADGHCLPAGGGDCPCTERFVSAGFETVCHVENEAGQCFGERTCDRPCDAPTPAFESCNGTDDDCDGKTDEDLPQKKCDLTGPFGTCIGAIVCKDGVESCEGAQATEETCNGADDDCDGKTDEEDAGGCREFWRDADGDGFGVAGDRLCLCGPDKPYTSVQPGDCDDDLAGVHPGVAEGCNGLDDDCDGKTDPPDSPGCEQRMADRDEDGWGDDSDASCVCFAVPPYVATAGGDCDDTDPEVLPGFPEACNGHDDNCDGQVDEAFAQGCVPFYRDVDQDGFGQTGDSRCQCGPEPPYSATVGGDCHDASDDWNPAAGEMCDGLDNDCDDLLPPDESDLDHDGHMACDGDCDDLDPTVHPRGLEVCNYKDDDCNGLADEEGALGCAPYGMDHDGDGWSAAGSSTRCLCAPLGEWRGVGGGDCDDDDKDVNPTATEACGGPDEDCDGSLDEPGAAGCIERWRDVDGDGYGNDSKPIACLCAPDELNDYTALQGGDCNDAERDVNPGARELCNTRDDDCDGLLDEEGATGCSNWLRDDDRDGFGLDGSGRCLCAAVQPYDVKAGGDCQDGDASVHPGALERCNAGKDDDCDGVADPYGAFGCSLYFEDIDGDGVGVSERSACACGPTDAYPASKAGDCDDRNPAAAPGRTEACATPFDDDCDGTTQAEKPGAAGCAVWHLDSDGDGFGVTEWRCWCAPNGLWRAERVGDCDDDDPQRLPGGPAVCGKDGDCDDEVLDPGEACDDGNAAAWDGCNGCKIAEFRINTTSSGYQFQPSVATAGDGRAVVLWTSDGQDGSLYSVYGQRLGPSGWPEGEEFRVNVTTAGDQQRPAVAAWPDGGFVAVWQSGQHDGSGYGVFARRYDPDGTPVPGALGGETRVNAYTPGDQDTPRVSVLADGGFQVVWESFGQDGSGDGIYTRRFGASGNPGPESRVNGVTEGDQRRPAIATLPDGRVFVAWESHGADGSGLAVLGRTYGADGLPEAEEFLVNTVTAGDQWQPAITPDPAGGRWFAWTGQDGAASGILFGGPGAEYQANATVDGDQRLPAIAASGGFLFVAWQSSGQDGSGSGVYARAWAPGLVPSAEFRVNEYTSADQSAPAVAPLPGGRFLVVWEGHGGQDGSLSGVFAQRVEGTTRLGR